MQSSNNSLLGKIVISGLGSKEYEHQLDRRALELLEKTPGLPVLVKKLNEHGLDRIMRIEHTGSYLKIDQRNMPELHSAFQDACQVLDVQQIPDFYMKPDYTVNAFTTGVTRPLVCITTGCIDQLSESELTFLLGHELGHIKSQHVMYSQMASIAPYIGEIIGAATLGIGGVMGTGLQMALFNWMRMAEFTADRAGLLACQDFKAAATAMMKIAGIPARYQKEVDYQCFVEQAKEFEAIDEGSDRLWKALTIAFADHPWTVMRSSEMQKWIDSGDYERVILRQTSQPSLVGNAFCTSCGNKLESADKFCCRCGAQL